MSSTRRAAMDGQPLSQERYMSSPEYAELRGINGTAVAARAALVDDEDLVRLLWFIQGRSLQPGGMKNLIAEVLGMYPDEIGSETLAPRFEKFLVDMCINPRIQLVRGEQAPCSASSMYRERVQEEFPGGYIHPGEVTTSTWERLPNIVEKLLVYQQRCEHAARAQFIMTTVGQEVWRGLDLAWRRQGMVLIEGREGRGKTETGKAYCEVHSGESRFASLKGITGKTNVFRTIAKACGLACGLTRKSTELQNLVEDFLQRSGLMLVIDEAHFLVDFRPRMASRPELLDWIDTAVCNYGVPIALLSTPQLLESAKRASEQMGWNWRQFRRRVKRFIVLPEQNTESDLAAVAKKLLPGVPKAGIGMAVGYARVRKLDVSGLADIAEEARMFAKSARRDEITFEDVKGAIEELKQTDRAFAQRLPEIKCSNRKGASADPLPGGCSATADPPPAGPKTGTRTVSEPDFEDRESSPRQPVLSAGVRPRHGNLQAA